jgi:hypothetical protein
VTSTSAAAGGRRARRPAVPDGRPRRAGVADAGVQPGAVHRGLRGELGWLGGLLAPLRRWHAKPHVRRYGEGGRRCGALSAWRDAP